MRVLQWIVGRARGTASAQESPFGYQPQHQDINWIGLDFGAQNFSGIMDIERAGGAQEAEALKKYFETFEDRLPPEMESQRQALAERMKVAPKIWHISG